MSFLKAIEAFFSALGKIAGFFKDRQLLDAGKDIEKGKQAENALKDIKHVKNVKKDVADLSDDELDSELFNNRDKG